MSTGVNSSVPRHGWELRGYNRKNGGNRYNTRNCEISIVMKIFLLYF